MGFELLVRRFVVAFCNFFLFGPIKLISLDPRFESEECSVLGLVSTHATRPYYLEVVDGSQEF